jgi:hypothetical protein
VTSHAHSKWADAVPVKARDFRLIARSRLVIRQRGVANRLGEDF